MQCAIYAVCQYSTVWCKALLLAALDVCCTLVLSEAFLRMVLICPVYCAELDQPRASDDTRKLAWSRIYSFFDKHLK